MLFWRFISTCVETARRRQTASYLRAVHLHVRGDSDPRARQRCEDQGSSPRAWRQPSLRIWLSIPGRFISTCVETAIQDLDGRDPAAVHLHVRGDSAHKYPRPPPKPGSSPRAWRQPGVPSVQAKLRRFISTCVETALSPPSVRSASPVHLHVRGDSGRQLRNGCGLRGSSPRAWRQQQLDFQFLAFLRFISTCVETALRSEAPSPATSVHLHVRGDSLGFADPGPT